MIAAVLLAAGMSSRMGEPKMVLPWKSGTPMIVHMVQLLRQGGVGDVVVVTGRHRQSVEEALRTESVILTHNAHFDRQGMISSVKLGLRALEDSDTRAVLVSPGDLPLLNHETVTKLIQAWKGEQGRIVAPSDGRRRGHPLILPRACWADIQALAPEETLRTYLSRNTKAILHVVVDDPGTRRDIDTEEAYRNALRDDHRR